MLTPGKTTTGNFAENLTPVRFLDSPRLKTTTEAANFATSKARLEVIISLLRSNYSKWQLAQKRGTAICGSIEAIKTRALEAKESSQQIKSDNKEVPITLYPNDLKPYTDKLIIIVSIFEDITNSAEDSLRQLKSLAKLSGSTENTFFRTWPLARHISFIEKIHASYRKESDVKQFVARELPHCMTRADLIRCTTAWEYPQYVDEWMSLMFAFLKEEVK